MGTNLKQTEFDGRRAMIIAKNHPHKGELALCIGAQFNVALGVWRMVFKNERTGQEFEVGGGGDILWAV